MSKLIVKKWFIPSPEDTPKEIKGIFLDDDMGGYYLTSSTTHEDLAHLFNEYPAFGLVNANSEKGLLAYKKGILVYGSVPLFSWNSETGDWVENKKLKKFCVKDE